MQLRWESETTAGPGDWTHTHTQTKGKPESRWESWQNFPSFPFGFQSMRPLFVRYSDTLVISMLLSLYKKKKFKKEKRYSAFSNTGLVSFDQPVKMIKGLVSVLLALVVVTSTMGKPEKSSDKTAVKKEKRIPQTLSRGECGQTLCYNALLRILSEHYGCVSLFLFASFFFTRLLQWSSYYLSSNYEKALCLFVTSLLLLLRMGWSTDLGSDLRGGTLLGTFTVRNASFPWSRKICRHWWRIQDEFINHFSTKN